MFKSKDKIKRIPIYLLVFIYLIILVWLIVLVFKSSLSIGDVFLRPSYAFEKEPISFFLVIILLFGPIIAIYRYKNKDKDNKENKPESYANDLRQRLSVEEKNILELMIDNMQEIRGLLHH